MLELEALRRNREVDLLGFSQRKGRGWVSQKEKIMTGSRARGACPVPLKKNVTPRPISLFITPIFNALRRTNK